MNSGIYEIVNTVNGHRYVGSAMNISQRWSQHKSNLIKNKHHSRHLQNAWNKYGADCFDFRVVEYCFFFMLIPREQHYIDDLRPEYNIAPTAGSPLGVKHSDEWKIKHSATMKGRKYSQEHKDKMSVAHIGKPSWNIGGRLSQEHKSKISAAMIGKKQSSETITKRAASIRAAYAKRRLQEVA